MEASYTVCEVSIPASSHRSIIDTLWCLTVMIIGGLTTLDHSSPLYFQTISLSYAWKVVTCSFFGVKVNSASSFDCRDHCHLD